MSTHRRHDRPVTPVSADLNKVHFTFDYSQCVTIPHHSRQMGPIYFVTGRKINMFGIRVDSTGEQFNYLIDEDQSIGLDGGGTHGPNSVISMLHHSLSNYGFGEKGLYLHADNCGAQNKNRFTLAYLSWRINMGLHENITLLMAIPGHTKCLVDGGFGRIKKLFKRSDCESLSQFADIVEKSAKDNFAVLYRNANGNQSWTWYDWKSYLMRYFLQLKGIQKYHSFRFTAGDKTAIFVKERSNSDEIRVPLMRRNIVLPEGSFPDSIQPAGLSRQRREYLYRHVRKYVRPAYQDETCPRLAEE
ncbi:uncharacterized protein LOC132741792 [Ruditapes philippinarum]|uniref:uncharacterized protein LOC132741792 n=1 Tax=Ruditapes philippinarum TaxID=129788 RepID=UPI00295AD493|nr:uncharacterized protein LOC132741792 [Ruditapes philippinarum]